jgi:hypothetical protein
MDDLATTLTAHHVLNPKDDEDDQPLTALTFIVASVELMRLEHARICHPSQLYLTITPASAQSLLVMRGQGQCFLGGWYDQESGEKNLDGT